jgi:rfaE bifunctional protein nucleotidyltransferase chain/domain
MENSKILALKDLAKQLEAERKQGKTVVLCHGCFDLMHLGHIKYLQAAKNMGNLLVVTVTPDQYVDKGPGRPVFNHTLRTESLAALQCVDYVAVNEWPTATDTLRLLRPDIYVKGQEFEQLKDKTGKIQKEYEVLKEIGAEMRFTHEIVFSSTQLINKYLKPSETES